MKKSSKLVVANWKMNPGSLEEAKEIFLRTRKIAEKVRKTKVIVCPPFLYLYPLTSLMKGVALGAQDLFWEEKGSFTGQISGTMITSSGAEYVIVGHSERRAQGDSDEMVNKKIKAAFKEGLSVILCIGERERDTQGNYLEFLTNQIKIALDKVTKKNLESLIIAYEPVWAIGRTDYAALDGRSVHETSLFIRKVLSDMYGYSEAMNMPILYGGSVNTANAEGLLKDGNVQGFLVGRQSLEKDFSEIISMVNSIL